MAKIGNMPLDEVVSEGAGTIINGVTQEAQASSITGAVVKDCGCGKRKDALNKLFPYNK